MSDVIYPSEYNDNEDNPEMNDVTKKKRELDIESLSMVIDNTTIMQTKVASQQISIIMGKEIKEQSLRNYTADFEDYLDIERRQSDGAALYTMESLHKLARILEIRDEKNYTVKQMKEFLKSSMGQIVLEMDETKKYETMMKATARLSSTMVMEQLKPMFEILGQKMDDNLLKIEEKTQEQNEQELEKAKQLIENMEKEKKELMRKNEELIKQYQDMYEETKKELEETKKKKRPIFGILHK